LEDEQGPGTLYRLLREKDPASAERIAPSDRQRLLRALELAEQGIVDTVGRRARSGAPRTVSPA
jgi:tRNA dimethylallyltransferase